MIEHTLGDRILVRNQSKMPPQKEVWWHLIMRAAQMRKVMITLHYRQIKSTQLNYNWLRAYASIIFIGFASSSCVWLSCKTIFI